jgi:aldose sugar dehydrogenase
MLGTMKRPLFAVMLAAPLIAQDNPDFSKMKIDQVYQNLCASCHGVKFEGGLGGSLVDGIWKYGSTDEDIRKAIRDGNAELGMTAFGTVLDDQKIRSMVIYLREKEKETRVAGIQFPKPKPGEVTKTDLENYQIEMVTENLAAPWAIAFLPNGDRLVTEKKGALRLIDSKGVLDPTPIEGIPTVEQHGQGGLMEVALHPEYAENGWVYLGLSEPHPEDLEKDKKRVMTAVHRGKIKDHKWVESEVIWRGRLEDYSTSGAHFGTRFVFKDGYLFFPVGERGGNMKAQDLERAIGKFYRIHDDGRIPTDNPKFDGTAHPGTWSYGHRNPQGVALHPVTGDLWSTEHGPRGGDELNLIKPGKNYGWPVVTLGMNYDGTPITDLTQKEGMEDPVTAWVPSIAVCGLDFYTGKRFPKWENDLLVGALAQQEIRRVRIENQKVVSQEVIMKNIGRVRDVATGPDGMIYVVLNSPDQLIRLIPAK